MIIVVLYMSPFSYLANDWASARRGMGESHYLLKCPAQMKCPSGEFYYKMHWEFSRIGVSHKIFLKSTPPPISDILHLPGKAAPLHQTLSDLSNYYIGRWESCDFSPIFIKLVDGFYMATDW